MAAVLRRVLCVCERNIVQFGQSKANVGRFSTQPARSRAKWGRTYTFMVVGCGAVVLFGALRWNGPFGTVYALKQKKKEDELVKAVKLTSRERRFIKFASVEFDGQLYMTPQDFLESVVEQEPRPRLKRRMLTEKEVDKVKDDTPALKKGSSRMFRSLRDKGIISYTEYLFLLSILTKPQSGFRIAFNMFDTDGNERVDKNEFLVLVSLLGRHFNHVRSSYDEVSKRFLMNVVRSVTKNRSLLREAHTAQKQQHELELQQQKQLLKTKPQTKPFYLQAVMEKIFSHAWKDKRGVKTDSETEGPTAEEYVDDDQGLQRRHLVDTTLTVHFFGKKGKEELKFEGFQRFMENLQSEVLELEFNEFSKGQNTISETDFAKILLRYTYLDTDEYDMFLDRLLDRVKEEKGITFEEFKGFAQFLNNLEDFAIAMKMYTLADHPISKDEFHRAVKICTGNSLSRHLVHTVFAIFDADGDGHLSYREFIAIMKDRLHRGFKVFGKGEGFVSWRSCVVEELRKR